MRIQQAFANLIQKNLDGKLPDRLRSEPETRRLLYPHVELWYWKPKSGGHNFGDYLARVIVQKILSDNRLTLEEEVAESKRLLAIGSILQAARDGDVVWGSGLNGHSLEHEHQFVNLDVRAVRGPITREFLIRRGIHVPEIYGDPALLLNRLFPGRFVPKAKRKYCVVGHMLDLDQLRGIQAVVSPHSSWNRCVSEICASELVISSSLHGIVVAEALGIGARYLRLTQREPKLKYDDYFFGTGREDYIPATSIEEALEMGPHLPPKVDRDALQAAFPIDLWRGQPLKPI